MENEVVSKIARKIRAIRQEKNLTIQQLATRSNVSKGLLSKIENSRTTPSLPVFLTIIQSLDISLKDFFHEMVLSNGMNYLLIRKSQSVTIERIHSVGIRYYNMFSQVISNGTMEAVWISMDPGAKGTPTTSNGYEFKYILKGTCDYNINRETITLHEGDALYLDASIPNLPINNSRKKVEILLINFTLS
jgi:transcriptional regulator with XRE-family HTH domain